MKKWKSQMSAQHGMGGNLCFIILKGRIGEEEKTVGKQKKVLTEWG